MSVKFICLSTQLIQKFTNKTLPELLSVAYKLAQVGGSTIAYEQAELIYPNADLDSYESHYAKVPLSNDKSIIEAWREAFPMPRSAISNCLIQTSKGWLLTVEAGNFKFVTLVEISFSLEEIIKYTDKVTYSYSEWGGDGGFLANRDRDRINIYKAKCDCHFEQIEPDVYIWKEMEREGKSDVPPVEAIA